MKKLFALALGLVLIPALAFSAGSNFSIRAGGGLGYTVIGEFNSVLEDMSTYTHVSNVNVSDDFAPFHFGPSFTLEGIYSFNPSFSVGLAVGYGSAQNKNTIHREYYNVAVDEVWSPKVQFVPVTLSGYYTLPLNPKWAVVVGAGLGYNWVSFTLDQDVTEERPSGGGTYKDIFRASRGTLGLQASVALEMNISPLLSVFASASFRLASASNFVGELEEHWNDTSGSGSVTEQDQTFWVYTYHYQGGEYLVHEIDSTKPTEGAIFSDVHEGKINIGGATLGFGLRLKL